MNNRILPSILCLLSISAALFAQSPMSKTIGEPKPQPVKDSLSTKNDTNATKKSDSAAAYTTYRYDDVSNRYYVASKPKEPQTPHAAPAPSATTAASVPKPGSAPASSTTVDNAYFDACTDAQADIRGGTWFAVGCLLGCSGWLVAYMIEPNPPVTRLLGKTPEYIAAYSDAYKKEGKKIQTGKALTGCLVGTALSVGLELLMMSVSTSGSAF